MKFLQHTSIEARLVFAISLMTITPLVALYQAYHSIQANIDFAKKEAIGAETLEPVTRFLGGMAEVRAALSAGSSISLDEMSEHMNAMTGVLADSKSAEILEFTKEGLTSRGREAASPEALKRQWEALAPLLVRAQAPDAATSEAIAAFVANLRCVIFHIGDTSNLILDPDLDSYYVMDVVLTLIPQTLDRAGEMAELLLRSNALPRVIVPEHALDLGHAESPATLFAKNAFAAKPKPSGPSAALPSTAPQAVTSQAVSSQAAALRRMLAEVDVKRITADLDVAFKEDARFYGESPAFKQRMAPLLEAYKEAAARLGAQLKRMEEGRPLPVAEASAAVRRYIEATAELAAEGGRQLDGLLQTRIASYQSQVQHAVMISLIGAVLSLLLYHVVVVSISRPLLTLNLVLRRLAAGEYDVDIPHVTDRSEIGQIAGSMYICKENGLESLRLKAEHDRILAEGAQARSRDMLSLANMLDQQVAGAVQSLKASSVELRRSSEIVKESATQSFKEGETAARASVVAGSNVQSVVQAVALITGGAGTIARQVSEVASKAVAVRADADAAGRRMKELNESVCNISDVILSIKEIAEQTNLLALNAAIEAARSGEYGRGFAVVAEEVKKLAGETAQKTSEIEGRITHILHSAQGAVKASEEVIAHVNDIDVLAARAAASADEQNAVTGSISRSIACVGEATGEVNAVIVRLSGVAERTGGAATEVGEAAERVLGVSDELDRSVRQFLETVRANAKAGAA